jgi:hypothetical protein
MLKDIFNKIFAGNSMSTPETVEKTVSRLINMNPYPDKGYVSREVADRQFRVIVKGFMHLADPDNKYLYIGDEVGLGKTYVALGIASLLRHFSENPDSYTDLILVPKKNLQYKWQKEIKSFIRNNYQYDDNRVRSITGQPAAAVHIPDSLDIPHISGPSYILMRNSSFSIASSNDDGDISWFNRLKDKLHGNDKELFEKIYKRFRRNDIMVKRAYALLMQKRLPDIDLLIVDEAHHFRHGVSGDVSIRNRLMSRMLGAVNDDKELFDAFPELAENTGPKVKKAILLSATPVDRDLSEIKKQLDCILPDHKYRNIDDNDLPAVIEKDLNRFMIRGIMKLKVNGREFSRNRYRHEHRLGNVTETEQAGPQTISDPSTALVLSLMQYLTIKELKQKNNSSFEMGMLAGFESFSSQPGEYEAESSENRRTVLAEDEHIISSVVKSYRKNFGEYLPHPKQDSLVEEIFNNIMERKKSLIYVRRIASVHEIERKLFKKYSDYLIQLIKKNKRLVKTASAKMLFEYYELEKDNEALDSCITNIAEKTYQGLKPEFKKTYGNKMNEDQNPLSFMRDDIRFIFDIYDTDHENTGISNGLQEEISTFRELVKEHLYKKNIKHELKELTEQLLKKKWEGGFDIFMDEPEDEVTLDEENMEESKAPYFFQKFFLSKGKKFKKRSYTKDWFEINPFRVNSTFKLYSLKKHPYGDIGALQNLKNDFRKIRVIKDNFDILVTDDRNFNTGLSEDHIFNKDTFLTSFLINSCPDEFRNWVEKHSGPDITSRSFFTSLEILNDILRSVFRQGSGLVPSYLAEALSSDSDNDYIKELTDMLEDGFNFVKEEIIDILNDYDRLVEKNFDDTARIRYNLIQQLPVSGISGHHKKDVRKTAIQFRMPGYPYALITTDILKEGEDLHTYCKNIYHYGIAWNPSDMEQRTGRIDRIDSLAYNMIKTGEAINGNIPFRNKLQVFYPYLIDTLEVNQMVKLFDGMENFIRIFYNDLSAGFKKDARAGTDSIIDRIQSQNDAPLEAKYDHDNFITDSSFKTQGIKPLLGHSKDDLNSVLNNLKQRLEIFSFYKEPFHDTDELTLEGNMRIPGNERHGPFKIYFTPSSKAGEFDLVMESLLGKISSYAQKSKKELLYNELDKQELKKHEINGFLWTQKRLINCITYPAKQLADEIFELIKITDKFEEEITGGNDENYE